ncbi:hypothetical protein KKG71_01435 [Patescibacteria group bacterium]|nr:hypothetical protein [Patescibacteria group bacterium]
MDKLQSLFKNLFSFRRENFSHRELVIIFVIIVLLGGVMSYFSISLNSSGSERIPLKADIATDIVNSEVIKNSVLESDIEGIKRVGEFRSELYDL